jgi:predicted alpha/beta superfamily hydrolase
LVFDTVRGISHSLQVSGRVRRFILVGIGYPGDNPFAGDVLRARDLTSQYYPPIPHSPRTSAIEGVAGIEAGQKHWHGAAEFLAFIRAELLPFIDERYPTVGDDAGYFGHSGGGGLGLHAMFSQPGLFKRYIISSPSISYDGYDFGLQEAREFIASGKPLKATVFMTVGDQEQSERGLERWQLVGSFLRLSEVLRNAGIAGLDFHSRVIPGETHMSVWPIAFSHGTQAVYGRPESLLIEPPEASFPA